MSGFRINFDRRFGIITLYSLSSNEVRICSKKAAKNELPIDLGSENTSCQVQRLHFTEAQKLDLMSGYIRLGRTHTVMLVSYYMSSKKINNLAGYLRVDLAQQTSQYHDLSSMNGWDLSFMNKTFYILHKEPLLVLRRI